MTQNNAIDAKINKIYSDVVKQQEDIKKDEKTVKRSWLTTCVFFTSAGEKINLQVAKQQDIVRIMSLLLQEQDYHSKACKELNVDIPFEKSSFSIEDWKHDLNKRLTFLTLKSKKDKLEKMEKRLKNIMSEDKRREMELDDIMKELGDE